jgi:hypothetical protein
VFGRERRRKRFEGKVERGSSGIPPPPASPLLPAHLLAKASTDVQLLARAHMSLLELAVLVEAAMKIMAQQLVMTRFLESPGIPPKGAGLRAKMTLDLIGARLVGAAKELGGGRETEKGELGGPVPGTPAGGGGPGGGNQPATSAPFLRLA